MKIHIDVLDLRKVPLQSSSLDLCQLGQAVCPDLGQLSLRGLQLRLHALMLRQVHFPVLLLQLLRTLLPLLCALRRLHRA